MPKGVFVRKKRFVTNCEHTDSPYFSQGLCHYCYNKNNAASRKAKGSCLHCVAQAVPGKRLCQEHLDAMAVRADKWRATNKDSVVNTKKKYYEINKEFLNAKSREGYKKRRADGSFRRTYLERIYNITPEIYEEMLREQNGVCFLCSSTVNSKNNGGKEYFAIDHDHCCCPGTGSCGKCIRKLLCLMCNKMLGEARDNPEILRKGAEYIEHHKRFCIAA